MNPRSFPCILLLALALVGGCRRDDASSRTDPALEAKIDEEFAALPEAADPALPVDATSVVEHGASGGASSQGGALDTKALAGKFSDGQSMLELRSDGSYVQTLKMQGAALDATGTWAAIGPAALLLDPSSKSAEDAVFLVASSDELNSEDGALTFRRVAAP